MGLALKVKGCSADAGHVLVLKIFPFLGSVQLADGFVPGPEVFVLEVELLRLPEHVADTFYFRKTLCFPVGLVKRIGRVRIVLGASFEQENIHPVCSQLPRKRGPARA